VFCGVELPRPDRGRQVDLVHGRDVEVDVAEVDAEGRVERRALGGREGVLDQLGRHGGREAGDVGPDHQRLAGRAARRAGGKRRAGDGVDRDGWDDVAHPVDAVVVAGVGRVLAVEDVHPHRVPPVDELVVHCAQGGGDGRQQLRVERHRQRDGRHGRHAAVAVNVDPVEQRGVEDLGADVGHLELRLQPQVAHVLAVDDRRLDDRVERAVRGIVVESDRLRRNCLRARRGDAVKEEEERDAAKACPHHFRFSAILVARQPWPYRAA
jgi:hypothetical protein